MIGTAGVVASFNGRAGVVTPQQSDYDSFFLTPAEGTAWSVRTLGSGSSTLNDDDTIVEIDASSNVAQVTLPSCASFGPGIIQMFIKAATYNTTLYRAGSDRINVNDTSKGFTGTSCGS